MNKEKKFKLFVFNVFDYEDFYRFKKNHAIENKGIVECASLINKDYRKEFVNSILYEIENHAGDIVIEVIHEMDDRNYFLYNVDKDGVFRILNESLLKRGEKLVFGKNYSDIMFGVYTSLNGRFESIKLKYE